VHVFGRFVRDAALDDIVPTTTPQQQQRAYLIERCLWPAMELITPAAQAAALQAAATAMSSLEQYRHPPEQEGLCDGPTPSAAAAGASASNSSSAAVAWQGAAAGECSGGGSLSSLRRLQSSPPFAGLRMNASQQKQLATTAVLNACSTTGVVVRPCVDGERRRRAHSGGCMWPSQKQPASFPSLPTTALLCCRPGRALHLHLPCL
jgi:hypothetical protein